MNKTASSLTYGDMSFNTISDLSTFSHIPYASLYQKIKNKTGLNVTSVVNELNPLLVTLQKVTFNNNVYNSFHHLCVSLGVSSYELYRMFVKDGKSTDKWKLFVEILLTKKEMEKPIQTRYGNFSSVNDFCKKHLLDEGYMTFLLSRGLDFNSACVVVDKLKLSMLVFKGETYPTLEKYCTASRVDYYATMLHLYNGGDLEKPKENMRRMTDNIVYKGKEYKTISQFLAKHSAIDKEELVSLLDDGVSFETAVDECLKRVSARRKAVYNIRGRTYATLNEVADEVGLTSQGLVFYTSKSDNLETALKLYVRKITKWYLGYRKITPEEYGKVFGVAQSNVRKEVKEAGSVAGAVDTRFEAEFANGVVPYKGSMIDINDLVLEMRLSKELLYYMYKKHNAVDFDTACEYARKAVYVAEIGVLKAFGKEYATLTSFEEYFKFSPNYVYARKGLYHTLEELLVSYRKSNTFNTPFVKYKGVVYSKMGNLIAASGSNYLHVQNAITSGVKVTKDMIDVSNEVGSTRKLTRVQNELFALNVYNDGVYHGTVEEVLQKTNIPYKIFFKRYKELDWDLYQAATVPVSLTVKTYSGVYGGYEYKSLSDLAKKFKIPASRLYKEVSEHEDVNQAMDYILSHKAEERSYTRTSNGRPRSERFKCFDNYYSSLGDISIRFDVDLDRLKKLYNANVSLEGAVTRLLQDRKMSEQVEFNNKTYSSIYALEDAFNWKHGELKDMVNAGQSHQSVFDMLLSPDNKGYSVYNRHFSNLTEVADFFNYEESLLTDRLEKGYSLQGALEHGRLKRYDGLTIEGYAFYTLDKVAKALGVSKLLLVRELVRGKQPDSLVKILRHKAYKAGKVIPLDRVKGNKSDYLVYRGKKYTSVGEVAKLTGLTEEVILGKMMLAIESKSTLDVVLDEK